MGIYSGGKKEVYRPVGDQVDRQSQAARLRYHQTEKSIPTIGETESDETKKYSKPYQDAKFAQEHPVRDLVSKGLYSIAMAPTVMKDVLMGDFGVLSPDEFAKRRDNLSAKQIITDGAEVIALDAGGEMAVAAGAKIASKAKGLFNTKGFEVANDVKSISMSEMELNTGLKDQKIIPDEYLHPVPAGANPLMIKSTMSGSPLEKQLSKEGLINRKVIEAHIARNETSQADKFILQKTLDEHFPGINNIQYKSFQEKASEKLVPLEKKTTDSWANYGLARIGFTEDKVLKNETVLYGNAKDFGKGSDKHFSNDPETLLHSRIFASKEEPKVAHVVEGQSDYYQEMGNLVEKRLKEEGNSYIKNIQAGTNRLRTHIEEESIETANIKKAMEKGEEYEGRDWAYWELYMREAAIERERKKLLLREGDIANWEQKIFLGKTHQERLLQEDVVYAAENGFTELRYPTSETAAKIQGYKKESLYQQPTPVNQLPDPPTRIDLDANINYYHGDDYLPEHKTILKKYDEKPKLIKKVLNQESKIITDSEGNTWHKIEIPQSAKRGKFEIKALSTAGIGTGLYNLKK